MVIIKKKIQLKISRKYVLSMQICKPKLKPYATKELLPKISNYSKYFCVYQFLWVLKSLLFINIYFCKADKSIYFAYINFQVKNFHLKLTKFAQKKGNSSLKQRKWTSPPNSAYLSYSRNQISPEEIIFYC